MFERRGCRRDLTRDWAPIADRTTLQHCRKASKGNTQITESAQIPSVRRGEWRDPVGTGLRSAGWTALKHWKWQPKVANIYKKTNEFRVSGEAIGEIVEGTVLRFADRTILQHWKGQHNATKHHP